jgi:hypothetical protein
VPGKDFWWGGRSVRAAASLWWSFSERPRKKQRQGRVRKKTGTLNMKLTGTLIDDLMAAVERAEQRAQSDGVRMVEPSTVKRLGVEPFLVEPLLDEPWFALRENTEYDSKFIGVA